jgi:hypothetical protein
MAYSNIYRNYILSGPIYWKFICNMCGRKHSNYILVNCMPPTICKSFITTFCISSSYYCKFCHTFCMSWFKSKNKISNFFFKFFLHKIQIYVQMYIYLHSYKCTTTCKLTYQIYQIWALLKLSVQWNIYLLSDPNII